MLKPSKPKTNARFSTLALLGVTLFITACPDTQVIIVDKPTEGRPVGDACVLPDDCDTGRCIAGVCQDAGCQSDDECLPNELCVFGQCEPADEFACRPGEQPLISVSPLDVEFGEVALGNTGEAVVTIENRGQCLLTLHGIGLASNTDPGFACEPCDPSQFPQRIPPQRSLDVTVRYSPPDAGEAISQLLINSDDVTAGDEGLVTVGLHATYSGEPVLVVDPLAHAFGYVQQGSERTETIRIKNEGTGNAVMHLVGVYLSGDQSGFDIPAEIENAITPPTPYLLPPYDPNDPSTALEVPVTFRPDALQNYNAQLKVRAHTGDAFNEVTVAVELTGSSLGPPQINVSPTELVYQEDAGTAYPIGAVAFRQVNISNSGQSPLSVEMSLYDPSGDFSLSPPFLPPIAPGGSVVVSVFYNPSAPSDPVNPHAPTRAVDAVLNITSNDDDPAGDVLKQVALRGWARGGTFDDVLKLELTYENADNSWAGNDFRDVNLELTSPNGFSCAKPITQCVPNGSGGCTPQIAPGGDLCGQWSDFGQEGTATWIALGQYEEPERILLYGLGQELANGGVFTARAHYVEDCANIPTGIFGDILGIGGSILLGAIGGAIGVPIAVDPGTISDVVTENCWDHESSLATLHVYVNGEEVASPQYRLRNKGDCAELLRVRRENGQFVIESTSGGPCN